MVLAELIQLGPTIRVELEIAATAAGLAIPPWIALGTLYEFYIILGAKSYPHLRGTFSKKLISLIAIVGGFSMLVMVGAVLYFLALNALVYFAISVLLSLMALVIFQSHLAKWWNVNAKDEA